MKSFIYVLLGYLIVVPLNAQKHTTTEWTDYKSSN